MTKVEDLRSITPRSNGTRKESQIKNIARHHSASATGDWHSFWRYWNKSKGWGTGGYHEIILRDGTVQLCYDPHEITNGVGGHNTNTYHICVVGNGSFTAAQERAWVDRCKVAMKRFSLPVSAVLGHNEFRGASTSCPGINMNTVRKALKAPGLPASNDYSHNGKRVESIHGGTLRFYKKPSWKDKDVAGEITKGYGFPFVVAKVKVDGVYQYHVQNSRGVSYYITASPKYVKLV